MRFSYLIPLLLFLGCDDGQSELLLGEWRGSLVTENGDSLELDPSEITFRFRPDDRYEYTSTLRYAEAGTYRFEEGYLFAQDTTQPATPERVVAVEKLTPDSLVIRMQADSAERHLYLLRESGAPAPE